MFSKKYLFILLLLVFVCLPVSFASDNSSVDLSTTQIDTTASVGGSQSIDYSVDAPDGELEKDEVITVSVPEDASGDITYLMNEKIYSSEIENGKSYLTLSNLSLGKYTVDISYPGDFKYSGFNTYVQFEITKIHSYNITTDIRGGLDGNQTNVTVNVPKDANGYITLNIKGENYTSTIKNGSAPFYFNNLGYGSFKMNITYNGDNRYASKSVIVDLNIGPLKPSWIYADSLVKYYSGSKELIANLTGYYGPIANATMGVTIANKTYKCVTDNDGFIAFDLNQSSGRYNVTISFDGDEIYDPCNRTVEVVIKPTIVANDIVKLFGNGTQYYALFMDSDGKILNNTNVSFKIHNITYTRMTNSEGIAKLNINLNPGKYNLTAFNPITNESVVNSIVVESLISGNDLVKYFRNATQYMVKISNRDGSAAVNKTVTFNINGVFYKKQTNSDGVAVLNINLLAGEYIITTMYNGCEESNKIIVLPTLKTQDLEMTYHDGSQFKAEVLDGQGKPLANQSVTFNINGVIYNKVSDSEGYAKLNINLNPGDYIITSSYNGTDIANTIKIKS